MSFMIDKLIRDYQKADEINDLILAHQLLLSEGNTILTSFINKLQNSIGLLDKKQYDLLQIRIKNIKDKYDIELKNINASFEKMKSTDSYDDETRKSKLNNINHEILDKILLEIYSLMYNNGWIT